MSQTEVDQLFEAANKVLKNSYSPYSGFKVASAVMMSNGQIYSGCNIENSSYGATVCAERVALWKAISEGEKKISSLLVLIDQEEPWPPCGMCRQVIAEFATAETPLYIANLQKNIKEFKFAELYPYSFNKDQIIKD